VAFQSLSSLGIGYGFTRFRNQQDATGISGWGGAPTDDWRGGRFAAGRGAGAINMLSNPVEGRLRVDRPSGRTGMPW
jgi:hypothetical protein